MDDLAPILERVAATNSRLKKVALVAAYLRPLADVDLRRAVRFLTGVPVEGARLSVGGALQREALLEASGWDVETVRLCLREVGDFGEAASLLLHGKTENREMTLACADEIYCRLAMARRTALKLQILCETLRRYRPLSLRYFLKAIHGNLRVGLLAKQVEEAVAAATGVPLEEVRAANNRLGNLSRVAEAARHGQLHTIEAALFHPLDFMLAKPIETAPPIPDPENWLVEDKYDGIRCQAHFRDGEVRLYTRGMEDTTASFPEIVAELAQLRGSAILDGEVLAWRDRALPFTLLQQRIARKKPSQALITEIPTVFIAYDLLYRDGELLLDQTLEARRAMLAEVGVRVSPQQPLASLDRLEELFVAARRRSNEGLILKRAGSRYESGRRGGEWIKVKRPFGTLDVVVTAAEQGHGKRATVLSDYTFAVRDGERFLNVGKAYSGLTDEEIRELTRLFRSLALERFGRVTLVKPEVVLEVAFDGVQKSPRHKSGYALRFPRILNWRRDKKPEDADTLEVVKALYEASLAPPG